MGFLDDALGVSEYILSMGPRVLLLCSACMLLFSLRVWATVIINPWQPIFEGVDFTTGMADSSEPRLHRVSALRISLTNTNVEFFSTPSNGSAPLETFGQTTTTFVQEYGVAVGVNANFFSPVNTTPNDPRELNGLAISRGVEVSPAGDGRPTVLITRTNSVRFDRATPSNLQSIWTAVAGSDRVVRSGTNAADPGCVTSFCNANPRTAVGVSQDQKWFYMIVIDGRQAGWSDGATLVETADWLLRFGAYEGLNLDGGGSSAMARQTNNTVVLLNRPSGGIQRVNGNHLGVFAPPLASLPRIVSQPANQSANEWDDITFNVSATGQVPLHYQWMLNGTNLPGATGSSHIIQGVQARHAGTYTVQVTNNFGSVTSTAALLQVIPQPTRIIARGDNTLGQASVNPLATNLFAIAAGYSHGLALRTDGKVLAWGNNSLGQGSPPTGSDHIVSIAGGGFHSVAINRQGRVLAWGTNGDGQCNVPVAATNVQAVAAGGWHSMALRRDGTVIAWGNSDFGQVNVPPGMVPVTSIACGANHSLALRTNGTVAAWGSNLDQAGAFAGQAVVPHGLTGVVAIAAGEAHSLALKGDGQIVAWGANSMGQCSFPPGLADVVAIAAGARHSLALRRNGRLVAVGDNGYGQCEFPASATNFVAIAAGGHFSLALLEESPVSPPLLNPMLLNSSFSVLIPSFARPYYLLERKATLAGPWLGLVELPGNGRLLSLRDPSTTNVSGFYRVSIRNAPIQ